MPPAHSPPPKSNHVVTHRASKGGSWPGRDVLLSIAHIARLYTKELNFDLLVVVAAFNPMNLEKNADCWSLWQSSTKVHQPIHYSTISLNSKPNTAPMTDGGEWGRDRNPQHALEASDCRWEQKGWISGGSLLPYNTNPRLGFSAMVTGVVPTEQRSDQSPGSWTSGPKLGRRRKRKRDLLTGP